MARREKYSTESIVKALLKMKGMVYLSAKRLGCHPDTIYERAKKVRAVRDAIDCERGKLIDTAETKLYNAVQKGEPWAIQMALRTIGKHRGYVEQQDMNLSATVKQIVVEEVAADEDDHHDGETPPRAEALPG